MIDSKQDEAVKLEARRRLVHMSHCNQGEYIGSCKYGEDEACPALTRDPDKQEALAGDDRIGVEGLRAALERLERANEAVCAGRVREQYLAMIDSGQEPLLEELDAARRDARATLSRTPSSPQAVEADVERVARAIDPDDWKIIDLHCGPSESPRMDPDSRAVEMRDRSLARARAAIATMTTRPAGGEEVARDPAYDYAVSLLRTLHGKHFPDQTGLQMLPDTLGVLTQIDNLTTALTKPAALPQAHVE